MDFLQRYEKQATQGLFILSTASPIAHCALGLTGEAGEVADLVKKSQYAPARPYTVHEMLLELGDVVWYAANMAHLHGTDLRSVLAANIYKLEQRHAGKGVYSHAALWVGE